MVHQHGEDAQIENDALLAQLLSAEEEAAEALYYNNGDDWLEAFSWTSPNGVGTCRGGAKGRLKRGGHYSHSEGDDSDEDWLEAVKSQRPRSSGATRKLATAHAASANTTTSVPAAEGRGAGALLEDDARDRERKRPTAWSSDEEHRFLEALELYGRDWKRAAAHVGTRSASNFRSHAQKYFIKLYKEGKPVPPKVAETGAGHTLSGKPLDPNSAAARAYLQGSAYRKELRHRRASTGNDLESASSALPFSKVPPAGHTVSSASTRAVAPDIDEDEIFRQMQLDEQLQIDGDAGARESLSGEAYAASTLTEAQTSAPPAPSAVEPTEYAKKRPKRSTAVRRSIHSLYNIASADDELRFVSCLAYDPGSQPFRVVVQPRALFMMDLHAHLDLCEVIGFLGGRYNPTLKELQVIDAFPCRAAQGHGGHLDVELDPESAVEARNTIEASGLAVVAWYHSHPTFRPEPSVRDLDNQRNYQKQFESDGAPSPFLAAIVSPYDPKLPTTHSAIQWFHVGLSPAEDTFAFRLQWETGSQPLMAPPLLPKTIEWTAASTADSLRERIQALLKMHPVNLDSIWSYRATKTGEKVTMSRSEKLLESLHSRIHDQDADGFAFLGLMQPMLRSKA
jgi:SHAQKYF class myb-like DNA-binding protein